MSFHWWLTIDKGESGSYGPKGRLKTFIMTPQEADEQLKGYDVQFASGPVDFIKSLELLVSFKPFQVEVRNMVTCDPTKDYMATIYPSLAGNEWTVTPLFEISGPAICEEV